MLRGRSLHFVFKIPERKKTATFYKDILGMSVLRHEEFADGCDAACNGPYANRWSKTMIGYGPENTNFAIELTYNYGISDYAKGNDFHSITLKSKVALERAKSLNWEIENGNIINAPGGYKFEIIEESCNENEDPIKKVTLASSDLKKTINYWNNILGLKIYEKNDKKVLFGFSDNETKLEFVDIGEHVRHEKSYGRIAFSVPHDQQPIIDEKIKETKNKILTPLISLDTPGKATVRVIILADPDDHEICFVDDEAFRQLSEVDPDGDKLFTRYMLKDA